MPSKPVLAAAVLALLWVGEGLLPLVEHRGRRASHGAANLALGAANAVLAGLLLAGATLGVTEWARGAGFGVLHVTPLPPWGRWAAALLLLDAWQYAWHRVNHRVAFLWRFHQVHHSDADMDATSGVRFHTGEILLSGVARLAVLPLLGLTVEQVAVYEVAALPVILFHHSNVRIPGALDRVLRLVIVTPWMHRVHHSKRRVETDSNYSSFLSVWDRMFGSFRMRPPHEVDVGLPGVPESEWRGLRGMLAAPFRSPPARDGTDPETREQP